MTSPRAPWVTKHLRDQAWRTPVFPALLASTSKIVVHVVTDRRLLQLDNLRAHQRGRSRPTASAMGVTCTHLQCHRVPNPTRYHNFSRSAESATLPMFFHNCTERSRIFNLRLAPAGSRNIWAPFSSAFSLHASQPQVLITRVLQASRARGVGCLCSTDRIMRVHVLPKRSARTLDRNGPCRHRASAASTILNCCPRQRKRAHHAVAVRCVALHRLVHDTTRRQSNNSKNETHSASIDAADTQGLRNWTYLRN